jgi:hypothetical protein
VSAVRALLASVLDPKRRKPPKEPSMQAASPGPAEWVGRDRCPRSFPDRAPKRCQRGRVVIPAAESPDDLEEPPRRHAQQRDLPRHRSGLDEHRRDRLGNREELFDARGRNAAEIGEQVHREVLQPAFNARAVRGPFVEAGREGARWSTRCRHEIRDMGRKHLRNPPDRRLDTLLARAQHQICVGGRLVRRVHPGEARKLARARTGVKALGVAPLTKLERRAASAEA